MTEFLAYKLPNDSDFQVHIGKWVRTAGLGNSGFVISDAHAENFWTFEPSEAVGVHDLQVSEFPKRDVPEMTETDYLKRAKNLIAAMKAQGVAKVVYSRVQSVPISPDSFQDVFAILCVTYPANFTYCLYNSETGFWMGSTPEILLQGENNVYKTMALAGTLPAHADDALWTDKEREEQQYVSDFLERLIVEHGQLLEKSPGYVVQAGPVKHLRNDFRFALKSENFETFVRSLHPTPAVCGVPTNEALHLYRQFEAHQRSLYTGMIGIVNENASALFVNLRCMQWVENKAMLYVGGGFTQDSDPHKEWLETERKADTLKRVIG